MYRLYYLVGPSMRVLNLSLIVFSACCALLYAYLPSRGPLRMRRKTNVKSAASLKINRYIPPSFEQRVENEEITAYELDRLFSLNRFELMDIQNSGSKGFAGLIFNLEGSLVNCHQSYILAFNSLAHQFNIPQPHSSDILDVVGLTFRDSATQLGILPSYLDNIELKALEVQFYDSLCHFIDTTEVCPFPGAADLLDVAITEDNAVSVVTTLPRNIAQKLFGKSMMSLLLEGRVESRNLVSLPSLDDLKQELREIQDDLLDLNHAINRFNERKDLVNAFHPTYGDRYYQNHLLKSCGRLYKAPMCTLYIDSNIKITQCAKKAGMSTVAIRNRPDALHSLRGSDAVVDDLTNTNMKELYAIVRRAVQHAQGPARQEVPMLRMPSQIKQAQIETPLLDNPQKETSHIDEEEVEDISDMEDGDEEGGIQDITEYEGTRKNTFAAEFNDELF